VMHRQSHTLISASMLTFFIIPPPYSIIAQDYLSRLPGPGYI
jgi:hypothetical protein